MHQPLNEGIAVSHASVLAYVCGECDVELELKQRREDIAEQVVGLPISFRRKF